MHCICISSFGMSKDALKINKNVKIDDTCNPIPWDEIVSKDSFMNNINQNIKED